MLHARLSHDPAMLPSRVQDIVALRARTQADSVALVEDARRLTYGQLQQLVTAASVSLRQNGIRSGDQLMLVCENSCAAITLYFAALAVGAWPVLVSARLSESEIEGIRKHCSPRLIVLAPMASPHVKAHAAKFGAIAKDDSSLGPIGLSALEENSEPEPQADDPGSDVAAVIYTTGTTGQPKGVMLTHRNLLFVASATAQARRLSSTDRVYAVLPMSHTLGLSGVLLASLLHGAEIHLPSRFDPERTLQALRERQISVIVGTPAMYAMIAEYARRKARIPIPAPALRLISSAGAPLDAATKASAEAAFGHTLHNGYGISECGPSLTLTSLNEPRSDCSIGRLLPGIEARLVGGDAQTGELWVRTPGLMKGYYAALDETHAVIGDEGWFRTGDLARKDGDGYFFIVGRAKELIIRFGFNVHPAEIEAVLNAHPAVLRSAVIGRANGGTEEVIAYVQPIADTQVPIAELSDYAAARLAPYKRPTEIIVLRDMPMAANGKIRKADLSNGFAGAVQEQHA